MSRVEPRRRRRSMKGETIRAELTKAARTLGYLVMHDNDARGNETGFPDILAVGYGRVFAFECKSAGESLRPATWTYRGKRYLPGQADWLLAFEAAGTTAAVVEDGKEPPDRYPYAGPWWIGYDEALAWLNGARTDWITAEDQRAHWLDFPPPLRADPIAGERNPYTG